MRIHCPHCGLRSIEEFTCLGDATIARPDPSGGEEAFYHYVYVRENPKGRHREYWHHGGGCRSWLIVERDTATHEISSVEAADAGHGDGS